MNDFYSKHKDSFIIMVNVMIIVLGFLSKNTIFVIIGLVLLFLSIYAFAVEKEEKKRKAEKKAELKALREEQKRLQKGKKKKKKKRK